jgi:CBS domain containing-hemolysin-like protein
MIRSGNEFTLRDVVRPAHFVPLTQKIESLLKDFQLLHQQIAIVKNEHGETAGIVTMEDIIEELVGDIQDEHDEEKPLVIEKKPGVYIVSTKATISDLNNILPNPIPLSESYDTVGGLVMMLFAKIPNAYEVAHLDGYEITVLKKTDHTVDLVRWRIVQ